eukprot:4743574-Pyramimonas_sp.AAC.1
MAKGVGRGLEGVSKGVRRGSDEAQRNNLCPLRARIALRLQAFWLCRSGPKKSPFEERARRTGQYRDEHICTRRIEPAASTCRLGAVLKRGVVAGAT